MYFWVGLVTMKHDTGFFLVYRNEEKARVFLFIFYFFLPQRHQEGIYLDKRFHVTVKVSCEIDCESNVAPRFASLIEERIYDTRQITSIHPGQTKFLTPDLSCRVQRPFSRWLLYYFVRFTVDREEDVPNPNMTGNESNRVVQTLYST